MSGSAVLTYLAAQLRLGRLSVLVGAGLSIGAGMPSWEELFAPLRDGLVDVASPRDWATLGSDLPLLAEAYETEYGRNSLIQHLRGTLGQSAATPTSVHHALLALPVDTFATTNYDALVERTAAPQPLDVIARDLDLAYLAGRSPRLVKLCGDLSDADTITVTRRDFAVYAERKPRIFQWFRTVLETTELMILGSSLRDPVLNSLWDLTATALGSHKPTGWIVTTGSVTALEERIARSRGLRMIRLGSASGHDVTRLLTELLRDLRDMAK